MSTREGTISVVKPRGFGFIAVVGGPDIFFSAVDMAPSLEFDEQLQGRRVQFEVRDSPRGPRAIAVRPVD